MELSFLGKNYDLYCYYNIEEEDNIMKMDKRMDNGLIWMRISHSKSYIN